MSKDGGMLQHIPNIITLINLACGVLAIDFVFQGNWKMVIILILVGGFADFCDGLVARALGLTSSIGKELDSLADMVSFGVVPGLVLYVLLMMPKAGDDFHTAAYQPEYYWLALPAIIFPLFAALRLAKFNTLEDTGGDFIGLSTPAATAVVLGFLLSTMVERDTLIYHYTPSRPILYAYCIVLPILMVSNIKMFSLKFKGRSWKKNKLRYIFILGFLVLLLLVPYHSVITIMILYIITNMVIHLVKKLN